MSFFFYKQKNVNLQGFPSQADAILSLQPKLRTYAREAL